MNRPIILTKTDARQLRSLLERKTAVETTYAESVSRLKNELERAAIVSDSELPQDIIALHSTVELEDLADRELLTFTLVMPEHSNIEDGRISILAPIGMALLGYREGDEIEWPVPGGTARMRIRKHLGRQIMAEPAMHSET
jgi:regulator of nucleoside diphosphate kinase